VLGGLPHPALVVAFGLERTLKYKKKRQPWSVARGELRRVYTLLRHRAVPALRLTEEQWEGLWQADDAVGKAYKNIEDQLDALLCAWLGALAVAGRMELVGDVRCGAIAIPTSAVG
jgi:Uncharacterized protein conserved in bacteria